MNRNIKYDISIIFNQMQGNQIRNFYCYNCCENFQEIKVTITCKFCNSQAIEQIQSQINNNNNPQEFQIYQIPPENNIQQQQNNIRQPVIAPSIVMSRTTHGSNLISSLSISLPTMTFGPGGFNNNSNQILQHFGFSNQLFNNLLQSLRLGQNNLVAATNEQINRLQKIRIVRECSICQEVESSGNNEQISEQKSGFRLPCNHEFHKICIEPWFVKTNTCPTCRKALD